MTVSEFKAWFEGYTECIKGQPSIKQWERIQARVAEIRPDGGTVIIREYERRPWWPTWYTPPINQPYTIGTSISNPIKFTPTFTMCHNAAEIGRLEAKAT